MREEGTVGEPAPSLSTLVSPPDDIDPIRLIAIAQNGQRQTMDNAMYIVRGHSVALRLDEDMCDCYLLKWKTQRKMLRKGS